MATTWSVKYLFNTYMKGCFNWSIENLKEKMLFHIVSPNMHFYKWLSEVPGIWCFIDLEGYSQTRKYIIPRGKGKYNFQFTIFQQNLFKRVQQCEQSTIPPTAPQSWTFSGSQAHNFHISLTNSSPDWQGYQDAWSRVFNKKSPGSQSPMGEERNDHFVSKKKARDMYET